MIKQQVIVAATTLACFAMSQTSASSAVAEPSISPKKRELLEKLCTVSKLDFDMTEALKLGLRNALNTKIEQSPGLNAGEKTEMLKLFATVPDDVIGKLNPQQKCKEIVIEVYDKFFNEAELNDLIAFYALPAGQITTSKLPALMVEAIKLARTVVNPDKADAILLKVLQETEQKGLIPERGSDQQSVNH